MQALGVTADGVYIDATFGRGGHARAILERLGPAGRLLAADRDPEALASGAALAAAEPRLTLAHAAFHDLPGLVEQAGLTRRVDGLLADLGVSSPQLDSPERGFAFSAEGPLDMRMDPAAGSSAAEWLGTAQERDIAQVLRDYGEERFARRIARAICTARAERPIATTRQLADLCERAVPTREPGKHPATRTFQALRIQVNAELDELKALLAGALDLLAAGGRLVVISFHSLEDRIVKRFIRDESRGGALPKGVPVTDDQVPRRLKPIGGAVRASEEEVRANPRARSAVLRAAERLA
jgi:16S rRNA (cytosine1402-N4)-methyltransferase